MSFSPPSPMALYNKAAKSLFSVGIAISIKVSKFGGNFRKSIFIYFFWSFPLCYLLRAASTRRQKAFALLFAYKLLSDLRGEKIKINIFRAK
jgi:hypothetical protein